MPAGGRPEVSAKAPDPSGTHARERRPLLAALVAPHAFRLRVAILMAAVSLASAYVTHVATERGSAAAALNGLASQQRAG